MRGLEELPERTKDRIMPILLLSPWVGSKNLSKSLDRITDALGERPFFLDLDFQYESEKTRPAVEDFRAIRNEGGHHQLYIDFVANSDLAVPVLQRSNANNADLAYQIEKFNEIERGFLIRMRKGEPEAEAKEALSFVCQTGLSNFAIALDCEWSNDVNDCEDWCRRFIEVATDSGTSAPIIISQTNYPQSFSDIDQQRSYPIASRVLYRNIARRYGNQITFIYGDWATTRPRENRGGGQQPPPRIDYPGDNDWVIFRDPEEWDFSDAAEELIDSEHWQDNLRVWGSMMIERTANGDRFSIDSPQKNVAARVNIHLHRQSWFGHPIEIIDTDDPYEDDL